MVDCGDVGSSSPTVRSLRQIRIEEGEQPCTSSYTTSSRTRRLRSSGARSSSRTRARRRCAGAPVLPETGERSAAACLWEAGSVEDVRGYVDSTLGDSSVNTCWEVNAEMAFAERPLGIQTPEAVRA